MTLNIPIWDGLAGNRTIPQYERSSLPSFTINNLTKTPVYERLCNPRFQFFIFSPKMFPFFHGFYYLSASLTNLSDYDEISLNCSSKERKRAHTIRTECISSGDVLVQQKRKM